MAAWQRPSKPIWPPAAHVPHAAQNVVPGEHAACAGLATQVALLHSQAAVGTPGGAVIKLNPAGHFFKGDFGHLLHASVFGAQPGIFVGAAPFQQIPGPPGPGPWPGWNPCQHSRPAAPLGHIG
jgi:hypothetical protein